MSKPINLSKVPFDDSVIKAFINKTSAAAGGAWTDGTSYKLNGRVIAAWSGVNIYGNWRGLFLTSTQKHLKAIAAAAGVTAPNPKTKLSWGRANPNTNFIIK